MVEFVLTSKGDVSMVTVDFSSASLAATLICKDAIYDRVPFEHWPPEMLETLGQEQTIRITFMYR